MALNPQQANQVRQQLQRHNRECVLGSIPLDPHAAASLELIIERGVFGSDIMSSGIYLAQYLYANKEAYAGKTVLDMGCGPGTQGIIMAKYGAKEVTLSDNNPAAVENTKRNIKKHKLDNATAYVSDLFKDLPNRRYDVIVFNHPFFPEDAAKFGQDACSDLMLRKSMLGGTELISRFFETAGDYLAPSGRIIMPYFHFAGPENDPANHTQKYGFRVAQMQLVQSTQGLQLGRFSIYEITR